MPINNEADNKNSERLAKVLGNVLLQSANESVVISQLEAFGYFSPMPADLPLKSGGMLLKKLDKLTELICGVPKLILVKEDNPGVYRYDPYAEAAIRESLVVFRRARNSVARTHLYLIGSEMLNKNPDFLIPSGSADLDRAVLRQTVERFWEHAETSYIRLASFWDRVGQILDFVFFNVRQYEKDSFVSVLDRVNANFVPISKTFSKQLAWKRLWRFHNSEQTNGLKWLLRRRNLLVHSLHLSPPIKSEQENPLLCYMHNHIEAKVGLKLKPGTPEQELKLIHCHLAQAANLFEDAVDIAIAGVNLCKGGEKAYVDYEE